MGYSLKLYEFKCSRYFSRQKNKIPVRTLRDRISFEGNTATKLGKVRFKIEFKFGIFYVGRCVDSVTT
jgi:hypothetical protein